ncbi:polysaccharide deacetylase family protein [Gracilibacillus salitolerans]|uniref:Beta-xylanase n=1 Tax=Gracilibacillus salitolerans TaxID=2663022 RepID=A0A5Q2TRK3_9BACI|nr:endo-1,4-beta-xylanase [Gracilibacillus salitolerans]QGH36727.1 polysaccharide deacetylase family protein [Gracilibacillus salitolerans]
MNRNFKRIISLFLVAILVIPSGWITPVAEAATNEDIPVLLYHRVVENPTNEWTDTSIEKFEQTMKYLQDNGYNTLSAEQYVSIMEGTETAPENPILLTFDDATPDFITNALPILEKYDMHAVQFVITDWIDGDYSMSEEQLKSLTENPNVSLQNHSKSHDEDIWGNDGSIRSDITREQAEEEITQANTYLMEITGQEPILMAYPYGSYNNVVKEVNEENGIQYAFKVGYPDEDEYTLGRHYVVMDTTLGEIAEWIDGPTPETESGEQSEVETVYHETFEDGLGVATPAGDAQLDSVSDIVFEDNENGKAVHVSERTNNWDGVDIPFNDVNMEDSKTYMITITGYVDENTTIPEGAQALLQNVESYNGLYVAADFVAGQAFTLSGEYTVDASEDRALRIQSNDEGSTVPFYIGDIHITEEVTSEDDGEEGPDEQRPPAKDFTTVTFEDQSTGGFEARGDSETLTVTDEANHTENGSYALKVEERAENWHGPSLRVEQYVDQGQEYKISAWVKLISPDSSQLQLSTQVGEGDSANYNNLQGKTISTEDGWVQFEGTYRYSSVGGEYLTIYIESSNNSTASFYIDDVTFEPTDSGEVEIEKDLTPIKDVYEDYFLIGNAVSNAEFEGTRMELLNMHHNLVTAENAMKPGYAYNDDREFDFTAEDALVGEALEQGLQIHGHVLVWHQQSDEWLHSDENGEPLSREEALENLRNHVQTTVEHFGPNVISWDVVNEAMIDNPPNPSDWKASLRQSGWYHAIGEDYVEQSFRAAKEVIDEKGWDIKLYYNDYNDDNQNKAEAIYQMVKEINENYATENDGELLIGGVGMQGHYNLNTNPENVRRSMEKFISLGVEVGVTELDITAGSDNELTEQQANAQGYLYAQLFQIYREHAEDISRVTFWGLNDATSWRAEQSPLLFDKNLQAKPAYHAVIDPDTFIEEHELEETEANQATSSFGTPEIDGAIDDVWSDAPKLPVNRYQMAWQGANGTAKTLWDDENLYVLIQVSDSDLDDTNENAWEQDSIEVFVDENNAKTSFYEDGDGQYRVNFNNETSFNPESIADGFESATDVSDNGYTVEVKIPFKTITPSEDTEIGFDVQINDAKDGARESVATWNDTTGSSYQDTSVFGILTLKDSRDSTPEPEEPQPEDPKDPGLDDPKPEKPKQIVTEPIVQDKQATIKDDDINKVEQEDELVINLKNQDSSITVSFTSDQVKQLKQQNARITINMKDVSIQLSASIFTNGDQAVDLKIKRMKDMEDALSAVYDFTIFQGDEEISPFDSKVTLSFKVDKDQIKDPNNVKLFYWNPDTEEWVLIGGEYKDGVVTAETDHFSTFAVFEIENEEEYKEEPEADEVDQVDEENELPDTATRTFNYLVAGLIILLVGAAFLLINKRRKV